MPNALEKKDLSLRIVLKKSKNLRYSTPRLVSARQSVSARLYVVRKTCTYIYWDLHFPTVPSYEEMPARRARSGKGHGEHVFRRHIGYSIAADDVGRTD